MAVDAYGETIVPGVNDGSVQNGQQVNGPNGDLGFWFQNGFGNYPEQIKTPYEQDGRPGFFIPRNAYQQLDPGNELFQNNEFGDFLKYAGLAFSGAGLLSGALPFAGTYGEGLMSGAEGGFDVGMGGGTSSALGLTGAGGGAGPSLFSGLMPGESGGTPIELLKRLLGSKMGATTGGPFSTLFNTATGLYGLNRANKTAQLAKSAAAMENPFGPERAAYAAQLRDLTANPGSIAGRPDFQQGQQALIAKMKSQGYLGSGNMATGLLDYSNKYYGDEVSRLAGLAGAQFAPGGGRELIAGNSAATDLASKALATLGYSARGFEDLFRRA